MADENKNSGAPEVRNPATGKKKKPADHDGVGDTTPTIIECVKDHGSMVKGKKYEVSFCTANVLKNRGIATIKEVKRPKKEEKASDE